MMKNLRKYGNAPFGIAVIHGGPGAPGEMAPVARAIATYYGVLEPLQTTGTLEAQVEELRSVLLAHGELPVVLIGHSWGAWLSFIVAARSPNIVRKLILVSSGPFEDKYAKGIMKTRLERLGDRERTELLSVIDSLGEEHGKRGDRQLARLGQLISIADSYDPLPHDDDVLKTEYQIFHRVWKDAEGLRESGELLQLAREIKCPVVAVHGSYDPHPAEGIQKPLSTVLEDFRFILLNRCGHTPWIERHARDAFLKVLIEELGT
ncbi:MAG: alpha/beta hydrolase [candidate division WOR-3 bacterium]|nr:MAG: alpha/beta hydrolase [candidate division WOR-3 bacterium]